MRFYFSFFMCAILLLLAACGKQPQDNAKIAPASLANARKLYEAGQFQSARTEVEVSIKAEPKVSEAHLLAGQIAEKLGDTKTALDEYVAAGSEQARIAVAALLIRARAYSQAEEWIAKCLASLPNDRSMRAYRALLAERVGDKRKARADAEAILAEDKGNVIANAVLAEEALTRNDFDYASKMIEAGLSADPSNSALLQLKAHVFSERGQTEKVIEIYRTLVAADPTTSSYRAALAELLVKTLGVAQGEQVLREGIATARDSVDMHMQLVSFLARHRDEKAVVAELLSAIAGSPESTVYDIALAEVYARSGGVDAAAKVLNDAMARTRPGQAHASAQLALARLLLAHGDIAGAGSILDTMLKAKPTDDEVLAVRGHLMLKEHNPTSAIRDFLSIIARQPANAAAFTSLAEAYLENDQRKEAVAALRRALSVMPSDVTILRQIVDIQSSFEESTDAGRAVSDFLVRNPASLDGRIMQIRLAIKSKDFSAADVALANLRQIPGSEQKAVALDAELKEARGQNSDAAGLYRRLIVWNGNSQFDVSAAVSFVRASIAAGQSSEGFETLSQFAKNVPPADLAAYDLGLAAFNNSLGKLGESQALVESAIQIAPAAPGPYLQQAGQLARKKDFAKALAILDRGIAAGAPKEMLLLARAEIQKSDGQGDLVLDVYRSVLRINPKSVIAANELAAMLADQSPLDKAALQEARDLLLKNAVVKNQAILDTLAWSDYRLGDYKKAKDLLDLANADQSSNPELRFHLGAVLIALGENQKGQGIIKDTLNKVYPGRNEAQKLLSD
ncbi:tetratricopeptide repeat protein [Bradyrhizobium sp. 76]|uniref:tetratricopeptide repeat protein n=1 Tax=Bradyrhizobium sp. 76 TaxID=2782680 RepID=UPI001FF94AEF|nr:tetratricopeptide repeat protein [Bradyrhizobium sp. 76]MCK1404929.1 tetratricopeptide repeat protein [Bradyrhizobium sp. 76]